MKKNAPFQLEAALKELEGLVEQMESKNLGLEAALAQFERGVQLVQQCQKALNEADQKLKIITQSEMQKALNEDNSQPSSE